MAVDVGQDFDPLTIPAVMPKPVRRIAEDGTPTTATLNWEQALQQWMQSNTANTNTRLSLVKAAAEGIEASVTTETTARIAGDNALAAYDLTLLSRVDDISASAGIRFATKAAPTGATASFGLYLTAGNVFAGIEALALSGGGSAIGFTADKFVFVDGGTSTQVLGYSGGVWTFNANVKVNGSLSIVTGTVGTTEVATNAITQSGNASTAGTFTSVTVPNVRAGSTIAIFATFKGAAGAYFPLGTSIGQLQVYRGSIFGPLIDAVNSNYEASGSSTPALAFLQTTVIATDVPGAGTVTYAVQTTNGGGVGGIIIVVLELAR